MKTTTHQLIVVLFITLLGCGSRMPEQEIITVEELSTWKTLDRGKATIQGDALILEETEGADGFFLVSPKTYKEDFTLNYRVKALSESSVLITLFSASQEGNEGELRLPPSDAPGAVFQEWRNNMQHYNLTFNNRSHGYWPFFFKNLAPRSRGFSRNLSDNIAVVGKWYNVEIGKQSSHLWFKLDDTIIFDIEDCSPLKAGHLIFRISGTTGEETILAKAAIKDVVISY